jgi:hypothetical protein
MLQKKATSYLNAVLDQDVYAHQTPYNPAARPLPEHMTYHCRQTSCRLLYNKAAQAAAAS